MSIAVLMLCATTLPCGSQALVQTLCAEPPMPIAVNGATATQEQMRAAMTDARNFIAQSVVYQNCLEKDVEAARTQAAAAGQPFDPAMETSARAKIDASKKAQEKAGAASYAAMAAFKNTRN